MRLIDADKLIEYIVNTPSKVVNRIPYEQTMFTNIQDRVNEILDVINEQPTAYDIDAVMEKLEELQERHPYKVAGDYDTYSQYNQAWESCSDQAIEIVKGGAE